MSSRDRKHSGSDNGGADRKRSRQSNSGPTSPRIPNGNGPTQSTGSKGVTTTKRFGGLKLGGLAKPKLGGGTGSGFGKFSLVGKKRAFPGKPGLKGFGGLQSGKRPNAFAFGGAAKEEAPQSDAEKKRLRRERASAMLRQKAEEAKLAKMTPEERQRYAKEKQAAKLREELAAKEKAAEEAEARRRQALQQQHVDPLEQFMQQLEEPRNKGGNSSSSSSSSSTSSSSSSSSSSAPISTAPPAPKKILTISFDDIVKQQQQQQQKQPSKTTVKKEKEKDPVVKQEHGSQPESAVNSQDSDIDVVGGSFLDAMEGSLGDENVKLEKQADSEVSDSEVDEATFHEEFKKELARRREAEARQAEANRIEEEKQRALEEKERQKQLKMQEGLGVMFDDPDGDGAATYQAQQGKSALEILREKMKKKELKKVDHSKQQYLDIKKDFYREHPAVTRMQVPVLKAHLKRMEIKVRGKNAPKPITKWEYAGLDGRILATLSKLGFAAPFAIQAMAIPALMSGRDIIGVAKTGSGKTLAFILPLFRHVLDQPPLGDGEGPIGLILAPARELAVQIYRETKKFCKILKLRTVAVYGGSAVSDQINAMKRGAEIVVATPGRLIDLLTLNAGKLISLQRVSYLVLDEADRMFDMGFEPQIAMVTKNIRPDRQTAMFSATFPSHVERLARKLLKYRPLEIIVGGRSKVASEIDQYVEVRNDTQKFLRLLQLLGTWHGKGSVLIFTDTQDLCDKLYTKLMSAGYYCLSLHSGKDQADRDQTIADFKNQQRDIMVATSLAGRGLDVKSLSLVVNYSCPNHLEDYVQRCGRTGRAGVKGTAYTFVDPITEEQFVPDVVKALNESGVDVPQAVLDLQEKFLEKVKAGTAKKAISGYKGKGHKFDADEAGDVAVEKEIQKMRHEVGAGIRDANELVEAEMKMKEMKAEREKEKEQAKDDKQAGGAGSKAQAALAPTMVFSLTEEAKLRAQAIAERVSSGGSMQGFDVDAAVRVLKLAKIHGARTQGSSASSSGPVAGRDGGPPVFEEELEVNDYPQKARFRAMHRDSLMQIQENMGSAVISKGVYVPPGRKPKDGERKLYLLIQGPTAIKVKQAKAELLRTLEEVTSQIGFDKSMIAGKYSVA